MVCNHNRCLYQLYLLPKEHYSFFDSDDRDKVSSSSRREVQSPQYSLLHICIQHDSLLMCSRLHHDFSLWLLGCWSHRLCNDHDLQDECTWVFDSRRKEGELEVSESISNRVKYWLNPKLYWTCCVRVWSNEQFSWTIHWVFLIHGFYWVEKAIQKHTSNFTSPFS